MNDKFTVVIVAEPLDNQKAYHALYEKMGADADKTLSIVNDHRTLEVIDYAVENDAVERIFVRSQCKPPRFLEKWRAQGVEVSFVL